MTVSGSSRGPRPWCRLPCAGSAWLAILVFCCAGTIHAQPKTGNDVKERARQLAREGFSALDHGQPQLAEEKLTEAIALYPAPTLYLARGRARLQQQRPAAAAEDFEQATTFAQTAEESPAYARARQEAAAALTTLKKTAPSARRVAEEAARPDPPQPVFSPPADAQDNTGGSDTLANVALIVGAGVTLALGVATIVTALAADSKHDEYHDHNLPEEPQQLKQDLRSAALTMAWINTALAGGTLAAGGTTLYIWLSRPPEGPMPVAGSGVSLRHKF